MMPSKMVNVKYFDTVDLLDPYFRQAVSLARVIVRIQTGRTFDASFQDNHENSSELERHDDEQEIAARQ